MPRSREILLPWDSQPQEAVELGAFRPPYFWTGAAPDRMSGAAAGTFTGTRTVTQGGLAVGHSGAQYENWPIANVNSSYPWVIAGSFVVTETTTGVQSAVAFGGGTASGLYTGVGQYTAGNVSSWGRLALGGADAKIDGPTAVIGQRYNVIRISRSRTDHVMYVNGVRYSTSTDSSAATSYFSNFTIGVCVRVSTPIFYGKQSVDMGFVAFEDPGDAWAKAWSLDSNHIFAPQTILVPVSAGGGGTTISATPGNAVADGTTASLTRTIAASPGNASADGTTASVVRVIGAAPGNAVADGTTAAVTRTIATTPGDAVADGVPATISTAGTTTISCTPGNAVADGALAAITRTIAASPGNAVADGSIAALLRVIAATPGNAVADGVTAAVQASVTISCTPGNAVADGVAATVTAAVSQLDLILKILRNRQELNPSTGKFTLYDDDGTTVLMQSNAWADVGGTQPYSGGTLARIDALI